LPRICWRSIITLAEKRITHAELADEWVPAFAGTTV
jgi:hypothetical protein